MSLSLISKMGTGGYAMLLILHRISFSKFRQTIHTMC